MVGLECKDCKAERERRGGAPLRADGKLRPAPYKGRCKTHHVQFVREQKARAHDVRVQKTYGLGPGDYQRLYLFQGQVCAICRRATGATRRLSVDHDHRSGYVRGLLCRPCNDLLGQARDDVAFFQRAIGYLRTPPAYLSIGKVRPDGR